jgi:hypothetical protein
MTHMDDKNVQMATDVLRGMRQWGYILKIQKEKLC